MAPPNQSDTQDLKTESQEGGSETGPQSGEPTPKSMSDTPDGPDSFLDAGSNPELYEGLGMDLSQFQDDPSAPTSQASDLTLFNPEQDSPGNLAPDFEDLEADTSTNQVSNQRSNQNRGGSQVDPPEMSFDSSTSIEDLQSDVTYGDKVLTGLANGEDISRPDPAVDVREPTAEGYDNTDIPFVRKLFGEDIQEVADPTGSLDEQTPITNTVEDITGDNIPSIGATIGEGIQYLTGQEYDMSDQEVLQWVEKNNPDFARQIDPENPKQSMENINEYAKRRLKQRQRRDAHDTLFPELRFSMAAKAPDPKVRREIMEMSDKELTSQYAKRAYQNQGMPAGADIIDDMISEGQSQLKEIREENPEMFIEAEDPEQLYKAGNELESHIKNAKESGEKPGKLVYYKDKDTGAEITFASPEKLDQYAKERRWRDLNYRDRGAVEEWMTGAVFRSNVTLADLGSELAQYGARLANQTGDVGEAAYEGATGMDPDTVVDEIESFQRDLAAIRETSQISESDDIKNKNFLSDEEGELFGEAVLSPAKLASVAGETFGLSLPGIGAAGAAPRVGKTLLGGMKMWGRAKKLREMAKAGKTTEAGKEITEGMIRTARFKEQAAKAGIAAAMYEMPLESAESLKTLYREEEDPSASDQLTAITSGMLSGYIGSFGDMALFDVLSKSNKNLLGKMDDELAEEAIKGRNAEILHAVKRKAKEGGKSITLETITENTQEITKDVADQFRSGKYETFEQFVDDNAEKYARTTVGSLTLSLFTGGIGGGRVAADIVKEADRRHMSKVLNRIGTDELQNWMGENSGVARIYNDIRKEGGDLAFAAEALGDTEALNQFETFFREQTEEDVASDLEIDIVNREGKKIDHVSGVEELFLRAPEIREKTQGQSPESSNNVEGMELVPEELDGVEDKGEEPRTEPIDGFQNEFETPLGKTFEGEGAKSNAREASEAEKFVGAVIDNDGEKQVVTRVDKAGQEGETEFRSRPVTGGQERVLEDAPTGEDVVAWRDKVSELDRSASVARKREAHIETANHENTQPYEDAKDLVDEAAENGTINEEEASEVKAKVDRYRDHQEMIASGTTDQDLRRNATRKRNELLGILQNDLDQIFQAENQEDVTRDLTQTVNQDGGSGESVPDRPDSIPETEDAPPQPSNDTSGGTSAEEGSGVADRPDDISETENAPPSRNQSPAEEASDADVDADLSATFDALEEIQANAIESEIEGASGRDAKTLQEPTNQTWIPDDDDTPNAIVYGPGNQRARVESRTSNGWYTLQPEDGGEPIKTRQGDGEWTFVPPDVEVEVTDPSEETSGDPSGMSEEEANEAANQDTDATERRTVNPDDPIDQQVADVYASHLNDPDLGDKGKANPRLFRDTLPQEWDFGTVERDKTQGPNQFGQYGANSETYWKVDTPDGSFLLPEPQIDVRSDETDTPEFSGVLGEMGTAEFGFGVSRDTARNNPSEISPVPYRDGRARPEGDGSSVTRRTVDDSRGPDAPELTLSSGDLRATELTETNVTVRDNGLPDNLDQRDFVYRSSVINDDVETRIQNQGRERDESVAVISKGGRHTSETSRAQLEDMGLQSSERQMPDRDASSADRGIEVNLAVNRALADPVNAESERALEDDLRGQGLDADVRTVRAETVDGKTVFRERGETTTTDDPQEFLVADVEGMEFIAPRVNGDGNIPDAQPLSGFSNRTYNESNYSTENGVPYENFDTTLDHAGQRVATDYFKSGQHSTDESSQYQGETVDYEDQTLRLESDDTSPLDMKKVYKSLNEDLSDVDAEAQEVQEEKIQIQSRAEREALERDDVSNPEDIQRAEQEILDDNDTYQELLDRETTLENKRQEITEKQDKIRQEVISRMEESSRTADDILPQRSDQQSTQQDVSGPSGPADPTGGMGDGLGGIDEDVMFSSQRSERQDMPNANGNTGSPTRVVREVASTLSGMWDAIPRMRVVSSVSDLPDHIQAEVGTNLSRVEGVFDGTTGQLYLVSENLNTKTQALNVALHEVAGHFGMREIVRDGDFKPLMREVFRALEGKVLEGDGTLRDAESGERNQTLLRRVAQEDVVLDRDEGDADLSSDEAKVRAAEEAMARIAETQPSPGVIESLWARLYSAVRRAVRPAANALGLDPMSISNAEIQWMMSAARNTLSEKGTTVTVDSKGVQPLPWTEMQMISPTFVSRMSNALQNPSNQTRETLRNGDPVDASVMQSLISDLEGDLFRPGEAEAIGLGKWLSQKADAGEQVSLPDVQSYVQEHQVHVSENQLGTEGSPVEDARQRVQRFRERLEEVQAEESQTYRDLDYAALDGQRRVREAAEDTGATTEQAEQIAVRFQKVVDQALEDPQTNPLSNLRDSLESQGFNDQIISIVDEIAQQIDEYASVQRRVADTQTRLEEAQQELQSTEEEAGSNVRTGTELAFVLPDVVKERVIQNRIESQRQRLREVRAERDSALEELQSERQQDGQTNRARDLELQVQELRQQIETLNAQIQGLQANLADGDISNLDVPNALSGLRVTERTEDGSKVLSVEGQISGNQEINETLQSDAQSLLARRLALYATEKGYDAVDLSSAESLTDGFQQVASAFGGSVQDGRAEISDQMKTELPERGAPLFRSSERQIDSDAFKQWFGDWQSQPSTASKAVDPDTGEPLVVYHGSGNNFTQFADTVPIYTTPETIDASNYAGDRAQIKGENFDSVDGANIMPLYVKARRPLDLRYMGDNPTQDMVIDRIADEGLITQEEANGIKDELAGRKAQTFAVLEEAFDTLKGNNIHSRIRESGKFDSVAFRDERPPPNRYTADMESQSPFESTSRLFSDSWVVYDKTQVKSAIGNEGTFFNGNGDIRYSSQQSESDGKSTTEKAGRGQDPDLEDIHNVQTVVGEVKKMLSQMQVPGTDGYLRTKEFALENGYRDLVDEQIGKIEVESYSDLQSVAQMAGHMLYYEFRDAAAEKGWDVSKVYAELDDVAQDIESVDESTSADQRRAAAMAKLIGQYLQGDDISNLAENLEKEFNAFAEEYMMKKNLDHVRDVFRAYQSQSDLVTAYGMMNIRNEGGYASQDVKRSETVGQWIQKKREKFYTHMYDMYYPTYKVMRDMNGGKVPESIEENTYLMARMKAGSSGVARSFLSDGIYALSQNPTETTDDERLGPSLREALQPVSQSQRAYRQFGRYAIARRAKELIKQKNDPNHSRPEDFPMPDGLDSLEKIEMVIEHTFGAESETFGSDDLPGRGHDKEAFEEAFDKLQEYNDGLLEYAVREGYLSRDEKQRIQEMNESYVPWNRVMEANRVQSSGSGTRDGLNFITGNSDLVIDNPIQQIIQNTHTLVNAVHENRIYQSIYSNIPTGEDNRNVLVGSVAEVIDKPQSIEQVTKDRIKSTLRNNGADSDTVDQVIDQLTGDDDSMISIFMPTRIEDLPENVVQAKIDGESVYMRLDEEFYNSIHYSSQPDQNVVARFGRAVQKSFRNLTTAQNPIFGFTEFLRDLVTRGVQTKTDTTPQAIGGMISAAFDTAIPLLFPKADVTEVNEAIQGFKQSSAWGATQGIIDQDIRSNEESRLLGQAQREETGLGAFFKAVGDYVNAKNKESPTFAGLTDALGVTSGRAEQASQQPNDTSFKDMWMQSLGRFASPSALRNFNDALENTNRVKEYRRAYDKIMAKFRDEYDGPEENLADDEEAHTEAKRRASLRAGYRARNVTIDFARKGKTSEKWNRYIPFFNAALQGWDRAKVTLQNNPRRAAEFIAATQVVPAIAVAMMNVGNPYYEEKGLEKDQYFLIPKSGSQDKNGHATDFWRIPKTHIYGPLFASPIERFVNYAVKEGHIDKSNFDFGEAASGMGRRFMRGQENQLAQSIGSQFPVNISTLLFGSGQEKAMELMGTFFPQALLTPTELAVNYSTFRGRPISPARADKLQGQLIYSPNTSKVAREIANGYKQLETVSGLPMGSLNPRYIDHGINSWLGTGGRLLTRTVGDAAATAITGPSQNNMEDIEDRAEKKFRSGEASTENLSFPFRGMRPGEPIDSRRESSVLSNPFAGMSINPLTKNLISKNNYKSGQSVRRMYEVILRAERAKANLNTMVEQGRPRNEIRDHVEENALYIALSQSPEGVSSTAGRFKKKLQKISENERKIVNASFEDMPAPKKIENLQFNWDSQVDLARTFMDSMHKQMDRVYNGDFDTERVVDNVMSSLPE